MGGGVLLPAGLVASLQNQEQHRGRHTPRQAQPNTDTSTPKLLGCTTPRRKGRLLKSVQKTNKKRFITLFNKLKRYPFSHI